MGRQCREILVQKSKLSPEDSPSRTKKDVKLSEQKNPDWNCA